MTDDMAPGPQDMQLEDALRQARAIKGLYVDPVQKWYAARKFVPFLLFRSAGIVTIILGVTLPAVAAIPSDRFPGKDWFLSVMSVTVAALTGLSSFFRWESTWRGRNSVVCAIDSFVAKWELELTNAKLTIEPKDRLSHVYKATGELIGSVRAICSAESDEFFSGMQFPQSDHRSGSK